MNVVAAEVGQFIHHETKIGRAGLAKIAGLSADVVGDYLAGRLKGENAERVRLRITGAIDLYRERLARQRPERFVTTDQSRVVEAAIMYALRDKQSACVVADSGLGKSVAAREVAAREFGVIYVACDCHDHRTSAFLNRLAAALGSNPQGAAWRMQRGIERRLTDTGWVLVIDDAHYLVHPDHPGRSPALDVIKDLQAKAGSPFVLLGVPRLWDTIERRVDGGGWFTQLRRRIGLIQHLRCRDVQTDDVWAVVSALGARASGSVLKALTELARVSCGGGYGSVEKAVRWSTRDGSTEVRKESLRQWLAAAGVPGIQVGRDDPPAIEPGGSAPMPHAAAVVAAPVAAAAG